ncbi:sulfite exporter TauE/SafE family protein [Oceanivirga miroungae]|uniref:Probable membrane transporter protein n=1 Tax=Oceanivirga miroungae TaxID=1130046 RepID=A0A6I8M651_9FUSO|nr:sulfite exporter TauE/SafE family protein [Oceanivirga miroungae]VWL84831.1 hypothetical protein OMES3154_00085 [Oceanivirga miroungae]
MTLKILLIVIAILGLYFFYYLVKDSLNNKEEYRDSKINNFWLAILSIIIFFFSTFGISDFALSTVIYTRLKWLKLKDLIGTINIDSMIPTILMALIYLSSVEVGTKTLIVCIVAQIIGGYIGPNIAFVLNEEIIKKIIGVGLIIVSIIVLLGQLGYINATGSLKELDGVRLIIAAICLFIYGVLNNVGIGSFSLTMVTMYLLGLDPRAAFPIMMAATTFSVFVGSLRFIKKGVYNRKIAIYSSTYGLIGVFIAAYIVKSLDTYYIKWIVLFVFLLTSYTLLSKKFKDSIS